MLDLLLVMAIVLLSVWFLVSIEFVRPEEMAVLVVFGNPVEVLDSGICFVPRFFGFNYIQKYPKKMYNLEYKGISVVTRKGIYDNIEYGPLELKVDAAVYLNFPRPDTPLKPDENTHPLIKILRAGVPVADSELQEWTREAVENAIRLAVGQVTWKEATEDIRRINEELNKIFKQTDGVLYEAGFREKGICLVISRVHLPPEIERSLTEPESKRLQAEATWKEAESQLANRLGTVLKSYAMMEGLTLNDFLRRLSDPQYSDKYKDVKEDLQKYIKQLHSKLELAERGAYFDLDSNGGPVLDLGVLLKKLGTKQ